MIDQLLTILRSPEQLLSAVDAKVSAGKLKKLIERARQWADGWRRTVIHEQIRQLKMLMGRIVVGRDQLRIELSRSALRNILGMKEAAALNSTADEIYTVTLPVQFLRTQSETRMIIPTHGQPSANEATVRTLKNTLEKALRWNQQLLDGEVKSMASIAQWEGVTQRYIARILRLAFLAPQHMQAIAEGRVPLGLHVERLRLEIPIDWDKQHRLFTPF